MKKIIVYIMLIIILLSPNTFANEIPENIENTENVETQEQNIDNLNIYSDCILLLEKETGEILYERNAYNKMYPASTTKMLTAILVLENCDLNDIATVNKSAISAVPPTYATAKLQVRRKAKSRGFALCNANTFCKWCC